MSVPTDSFFTQRTVLGPDTFILTFRYNARMDRWILDIADASNNVIEQGMVILASRNVYGLYINKLAAQLPAGSLIPVDMTGQGRDPQLKTLGGDVLLGYSTLAAAP